MTILWVMDAFERMNEPQSRKEESVQLEDIAHDPEGTIGRLTEEIRTLSLRMGRLEALYESSTQVDELVRDGYQRGLAAISPDSIVIDRRAVEESSCDACGHKHLRYEPWHIPGNYRSYRAFAVCGNCGHREEF